MDRVKLLNMAIFGLSLRTLNQIKNMVEVTLPDAIQVNWTNIANPDLNILLINDMFIESSNIQRLINNKKMRVLKLAAQRVEHHVDTFDLSSMDQNIFKKWLLESIDATLHSSDTALPFLKQHHKSLPFNEKASIDLIQQIVNPANGSIRVFDRFGELAVCDTRLQWAWVNEDRKLKFTDLSINYTHATYADSKQPHLKQMHLQLWLWNLLWNSPEYLNIAPQQGHYQLMRWPQPYEQHDQKMIIKIATCFNQGAAIQDVAKYLEISPIRVHQFIAASLALGFVKSISASEAKFNPYNNQTNIQETGKIKGFFSRLRQKLGI